MDRKRLFSNASIGIKNETLNAIRTKIKLLYLIVFKYLFVETVVEIYSVHNDDDTEGD